MMGGASSRHWIVAQGVALVGLGCAPPSPGAGPSPCGPGAALDEPSGQCFCEPGHHGDPTVECPPHPDLCAEASERLGHLVCVHALDDEEQWARMSIGGGTPLSGIKRTGKYMVPIDGDARLPAVISDANAYRLHYCLMSVGFAPLFPGLTPGQYASLILTHAGREFYAGSIYELQTPREVAYGFSIETAPRPDEQLDVDTVHAVYRQLADRFAPGDLGYLPRGSLQEEAMRGWSDPPFVLLSANPEAVPYEAYTPGIAFGRVRLDDPAQSEAYGWQDLVVFDEVPLEFEGVLAGAVTGQRQDVLSHLNVLSGQRGTPNAFVIDARQAFAPLEGQLVRLEAQTGYYSVQPATQAEAEAYWQAHRPALAVENPAELDYAELDAFTEIPTDTAEQRALARARFGAKTVGLAVLSRLLEPDQRTTGLGVPMRYYDEFMATNTWQVDVGAGPQVLAYAETLDAWLADEEFRTDAAVRQQRLAALRAEMRAHGEVSPALVQALHDRIALVFGSDRVMVRVRSSSNAEDTPSFNGAGLYDSASACAADSLPGADPSESACDSSEEPRPLEAALVEVWASLWNQGAFEERDYYQLDHAQIAMGATVSLRYEGERANGVAFTGDPVDPRSGRYTVDAQLGEVPVVSPTPGVTAELSHLTMADGRVVEIERSVPSSLVPPGQAVLDDARLRELGALMAELADAYPIDAPTQAGEPPILDIEFKITSDQRLVIKQIRTFQPSPYSPDASCLD